MKLLSSFLKEVSDRNPDADLDLVSKAYKYAKVAHDGQQRADGEEFFVHPFTVSQLLIENGIADTATLCAALLHDIVEKG
jgi:GTP pyrophosphokinase